MRTDHTSLRWLLNFKDPEGVVARWISILDTYNFENQHRPGRHHGNADGLSRRPRRRCEQEECLSCAVVPKEFKSKGTSNQQPVTLVQQVSVDQPDSDEPNWIGSHDLDSLRKFQKKDPHVSQTLTWKQTLDKPPAADVFTRHSKQIRQLCLQ